MMMRWVRAQLSGRMGPTMFPKQISRGKGCGTRPEKSGMKSYHNHYSPAPRQDLYHDFQLEPLSPLARNLTLY